ncbi:MAG: hypothetical protein Q8M56_03850 [Desulfobacterales bacterium]|nr:hypothetical protein [Desulfobacterales bacterium]
MSIYPLGLFGSNGCGYAAVDKGQGKILRFAYAHTPDWLLMITQ